uniref:Methyltransferase type 11 domain-containing protein n=1 Tax=viral metagenome TaxID=1070528 RepID=A0A6C0F8F6_9ZZZZ|tara:strand:+ start:1126 stop:1725 length:600 start_codon:yes stop_codon:yes gene_type:complete
MDLRKVYNAIAIHFSATRYKTWPCVDYFFQKYVAKNSYILDAGCGNGKNINTKHLFECCDISEEFLKIVNEKYSTGLTQCQLQNLPYRKSCFDHIICVAVLHHLKTPQLRVNILNNMIDCLQPGGYLLLTNWAFENNKYSSTQDCFIPFKNKQGQILANRYYHLFQKNELISLFSYTSFKIIEFYNEYNNWIIIAKKTF